MPTQLPLVLRDDHVERVTASRRPLSAVLELVWNALDADATSIVIEAKANDIGGVAHVRVTDDGHGIDPSRVEELFSPLGGSWKAKGGRTPGGRALHGSLGQGRLKAFGLGEWVRWDTSFVTTTDGLVAYSIAGRSTNLKDSMGASDPLAAEPGATAGTTVLVTNLHSPSSSLLDADAPIELGAYLAVYLAAYPGVLITYNGTDVDPEAAVARRSDHPLNCDAIPEVGEATLSIIEWRHKSDRRLYVCNSQGCALDEESPGIQAPGFSFTAYLVSPYIDGLSEENLLVARELLPTYVALQELAKRAMRDYFEARKAEEIQSTVKRWQADDVYPYEGETTDPVEIVERQVFDVAATYVSQHLDDFESKDKRGRQLTFRLLKQALERSPTSLVTILEEVLDLPVQQREDLARLLSHTSLSAIINSSKTVHDRLVFIEALARITTDKELWPHVKEVGQLHRILAENTWVLGEQYHLMVDEGGLTQVLREVIRDQKLKVTIDPVKIAKGNGKNTSGRVDLMFGRADRHGEGQKKRYLVVELKRPSVIVGDGELTQCRKYGYALANHPRFIDTDTEWDVVLLTRDIDAISQTQIGANGLVQDYPNTGGRFRVWCKRWSNVIREAGDRHQFYKAQLQVEISSDDALSHLRKAYSEYLPDAVNEAVAE